MAGLLDFVRTPEGQGLLSAAFGGLAGARRGQPLNSIGRAGMSGLLGYGQATERQDMLAERAKADEVRNLQMEQARQQIAANQRLMDDKTAQREWVANNGPRTLAAQSALSGGGGPTKENAAKMPPIDPFAEMVWRGAAAGVLPVSEYMNLQKPEKPEYKSVGNTMLEIRKSGVKPVFSETPKPEAAPSSVREYQFARDQGYKGSFQQWVIDQKRAGASSNSTNVTYGAPVAGIGPDGSPVFFQPPNRAGEPPQIIPGIQPPKMAEDIREREQQRATTIQGVEDSIRVLDKALTHPGLEIATGLQGAIDPRNYIPGTEARNFQVLKDQIGGKAFLQAFESLKGGGQITEVEGKKATDAIARLNTAQSTEEYRAALSEFREVVDKGYERMTGKRYQPKGRESAGRVGGAATPAPAAANPQNVVQALPTNVPKGSRARDLSTGGIMVFDGMRWKPEGK